MMIILGRGQEIKNRAKQILDIVKNNPILDAGAKNLLPSIPFIGGFLAELYGNYVGTSEEKNQQIKKLLDNFSKLNSGQLEDLSEQLIENKEDILRNQNYLQQLVTESSLIVSQLQKIEREGELTSVKIQLDLTKMNLQLVQFEEKIVGSFNEAKKERKVITENQDKLTQMMQQLIKNQEELDLLKGYFERNRRYIKCYEMRRELGLRNSSNLVEGMNNTVVSQRQKNQGMSWTRGGSAGLALLTALKVNKEREQWLKTGTLNFSFAA